MIIDAYLARTLKDPSTRRIEYEGNGGLVCGTIDTDKQPFYAYFGADGNIAQSYFFSDSEFKAILEKKYSTIETTRNMSNASLMEHMYGTHATGKAATHGMWLC